MSKQTINIGASPNDGTGTPLRTSFDYTNQNFTELYTAVGPSGNNIVVPGNATITGDLTVDTSTLKVDSTNNRVIIGATTVPDTFLKSYITDAVAGTVGIGTGFSASAGYLGTWTNHPYVITANGIEQLRVAPLGVYTFSDGAGGTRMTLNSTGLGIGASPTAKLDVVGGFIKNTATTGSAQIIASNTGGVFTLAKDSSTGGNFTGTAYASVLYSDGAFPVCIFSNGSERLRIDSAGNCGIGVTPSAFGGTFKALQIGYAGLRGSTATAGLSFNGYFDGTDFRYIASSTKACDYFQNSGKHVWQIADVGTAGNVITFTQAMTLDASGNLLVGTTSVLNSARVSLKAASVTTVLSLNGVTGDTAQESLVINKFDSNSTTSQVFVRFTNNNGSSGSGQINGNGASQAAFGSFSDSRLKENILSLPSQLANILSLRPVEFDYKDGSGHQIGFVAQEMQEVYSDAVGEQNGFLTVTGWSKTEARLVSAIKELAAKVQALEAKLA